MSYARHLPVLMYHHVSDKPGQITLSPRTFRAQMKWLAESGWKTVTAAELAGKPLPQQRWKLFIMVQDCLVKASC